MTETGPTSPRAESAGRLITFYVVVVALALEKTAENLFSEDNGALIAPGVLLSVATLVTLVPFAHGALRHLDVQYIHGDDTGRKPLVRRWALLADFCALLVEGMLFLAMTRSAQNPGRFVAVFAALLAVDVVWAVCSKTIFLQRGLRWREVIAEGKAYLKRLAGKGHGNWPQLSWGYNNLVFVALALGLLQTANSPAVPWHWNQGGTRFAAAILALAALRTMADYWVSWPFYFPEEVSGEHGFTAGHTEPQQTAATESEAPGQRMPANRESHPTATAPENVPQVAVETGIPASTMTGDAAWDERAGG